eukprot:g19832.t1
MSREQLASPSLSATTSPGASTSSASSSSGSNPLNLALLTNRALRKDTIDNIVAELGSDLGRLLLSIPKQIGPERAFLAYKRMMARKIVNAPEKMNTNSNTVKSPLPSFVEFEKQYRRVMPYVKWEREKKVDRNFRKRMKPHLLRSGNQSERMNETCVVPEEDAEVNDSFVGSSSGAGAAESCGGQQQEQVATSSKSVVSPSLLYDLYLSEVYALQHAQAAERFGGIETNHPRPSRLQTVVQAARRDAYLEKNRPVLANELSDFRTPYMQRRSILQKALLQLARNKVEVGAVEKVLNADKSLVGGRLRGDLPPEALEPVYAFSGTGAGWSFDARRRAALHLQSAAEGLSKLGPEDPYQPSNHLLGSYKFGKPPSSKWSRLLKQTRYPTLNRVANRLPLDRVYRAHVLSVINVLERQKGWRYEDKLQAVQSLKEVYGNLRKSGYWRRKLDKKLPLNCPSKRERKKYGHGHANKYVQQVLGGGDCVRYEKRQMRLSKRSLCRDPCRKVEIE